MPDADNPKSDVYAEIAVQRRAAVRNTIMALLTILLVGVIAGIIDSRLHPGRGNAFFVNAQDLLLVLASTAPWIVFFFLLCWGWVWIADRIFMKWNRVFYRPDEEAHGKGIMYEIVRDNNAAAAIVLILPTVAIALALIYIAILNKSA